jgi:hypothetical protein
MAYGVGRIFAGSSTRPVEEVDDAIRKELVPLLRSVEGISRFSTFSLNDGRIGSYAVCDNKEIAERGQKIGAEWRAKSALMQDFKQPELLCGEIIYAYGDASTRVKQGNAAVIRVYDTAASPQNVAQAFEQEAEPILKASFGVIRYGCLALESGGFAVFTASETREASAQLTEQAREARNKRSSLMNKVFPKEPRVMEGVIIGAHLP